MFTSEQCWLKSSMCEVNADRCGDPASRLTWLRLANDWRDLALDADAQATTARLLEQRRAAL